MPTIGNITFTEPTPSTTFPLVTDFPWGRVDNPPVAEHRMGANSANGKVTQRYKLGTGAKTFTIKVSALTPQKRQDLIDFWFANRGAYGSFYYNAPNEDGTFTEYVCRFADQNLELDYLYGAISSVGVQLVEFPQDVSSYTVAAEALRIGDRLLPDSLEEQLAKQVQEIIPLIRIECRDGTYPVIYLSDRRCVVGENTYEPRLLDWDGIEQSMDGSSDVAQFTLGNADRVLTLLANDVDLYRADLQFSLYHVGTQTKLNLWRGDVIDWNAAVGSPELHVSASDGFYELKQSYPRRKVSRTCWKKYKDALLCPWADESNQTYTERSLPQSDGSSKLYVFQPDDAKCDKSWDGPNGCLAHGMESRFGGIVAYPQSVRTKDNSTGHFGFGRSPLTSTSLIADSIYGQVIPEIYAQVNHYDPAVGFPVNCKIAAGRDEGDFYTALGIVGEGPIVEYASPRFEPLTAQALVDAGIRELQPGESPATIISLPFNPHKLDGQDHHGFVSDKNKNNYGLRLGNITGVPPTGPHMGTHGLDPVPADTGSNFSLGEGGAGIQRYGPERAAGTAFCEIRRKDEKGLQLSRLEEHAMQVSIRQGLAMWTWTDNGDGTFTRAEEMFGTWNPIWIAVNVILRAKGLLYATAEEQIEVFDCRSACSAAAICDEEVTKMIGTGKEIQFRFIGILQEAKPLRDWLQEILNTCLGYYTFAFDRIRFGLRANSSAIEQFSDGNVVWGSLQYEPLKPAFWQITGNFADEEYGFVANSVEIYDETYGERVGGVPQRSEINYVGVPSKSQIARLITTRLREELGGWQEPVQRVARRGRFKTTLLGLSVEPGMVCRFDHEDMPDYPATAEGSSDPEEARKNHIQFRVQRWRLNKDYSIDVDFRTVHNEVYDLISGPKPADVGLIALPQEETFKPADWRFYASTQRDGFLRLNRIAVGTHKQTVHRGTFEVYHCNEASNAYGTVVGTISDSDTSFTMSGHPPVDGLWIMIDSELMYVERYEPIDSNFGTVTVQRGQIGTKASAHSRHTCTVTWKDPDNPCHLRVDTTDGFLPGARVVVNDGGPDSQQPIATVDGSDLYTTLPVETADVGDELYTDPRLWMIDLRHEEVTFQPRFFSSANRSKWEYPIELRNAGVVMIRGTLINTRGIKSDPVYVFPSGGDGMNPATAAEMSAVGFSTPWPHRIRTLGGQMLQFPRVNLPVGELEANHSDPTKRTWQPIRLSEAQPFEKAYAEVTGGVANAIAPPAGVSAVVPTELRASGTITLSGEIDAESMICVTIEGDNELLVPTWVARDHAGVTTLEDAAEALRDWMNGDEAFPTYYSASASGGVVTITAKGTSAGEIVTDVAGSIVATADGMTSRLGVLTGRKYACAYRAGSYLSALSPVSASTGPTGAADRVEIKDIPVSGDDRVTAIWLYATPDGADEPFYLVAETANGTEFATDSTHESGLTGQPSYPGAIQPGLEGTVSVVLKKNGTPWCQMVVPKDGSKSNEVHGFALDPAAEGTEITLDVNNQAEELDLAVTVQ